MVASVGTSMAALCEGGAEYDVYQWEESDLVCGELDSCGMCILPLYSSTHFKSM